MNKIYKKFKLVTILIVSFLMVSCARENGKYNYPKLDVRILNLRDNVKYLTDIRPYRNYINTESLDKTAAYIADKLSSYGLSYEMIRVHKCKPYPSRVQFGIKEAGRCSLMMRKI